MNGRFSPDQEDGSEEGSQPGKQGHNSGEGCRELARGSQAEAEASTVPNLRLRLENSAATWNARADMLERLDRKRTLRLESEGEGGDTSI